MMWVGVMWEESRVGDVGGVRSRWCGRGQKWGDVGGVMSVGEHLSTHNWDHLNQHFIVQNSAHWLFTCLSTVCSLSVVSVTSACLWICLFFLVYVVCVCVYLHTCMHYREWVKRQWGFCLMFVDLATASKCCKNTLSAMCSPPGLGQCWSWHCGSQQS